jgi:hypothetical protein
VRRPWLKAASAPASKLVADGGVTHAHPPIQTHRDNLEIMQVSIAEFLRCLGSGENVEARVAAGADTESRISQDERCRPGRSSY